MAGMFGQAYGGIPGRVMGLPYSQKATPTTPDWIEFGVPGAWFTGPVGQKTTDIYATEEERQAARAYAIAYQLMPYLSQTSQWDVLNWLNTQAQAPGVATNVPGYALGSVGEAMSAAPGYMGEQGLRPGSIQQMIGAVRALSGAGVAAGGALGAAGEKEGAWLQSLAALQAMGDPRSRSDWETYTNLRTAALGAAPAGLSQLAGSFLMPQFQAPQISSPYRASLGSWFR